MIHCRVTKMTVVLGYIFIKMPDAKAYSLGSLRMSAVCMCTLLVQVDSINDVSAEG